VRIIPSLSICPKGWQGIQNRQEWISKKFRRTPNAISRNVKINFFQNKGEAGDAMTASGKKPAVLS
jgi:hypothetical protein